MATEMIDVFIVESPLLENDVVFDSETLLGEWLSEWVLELPLDCSVTITASRMDRKEYDLMEVIDEDGN